MCTVTQCQRIGTLGYNHRMGVTAQDGSYCMVDGSIIKPGVVPANYRSVSEENESNRQYQCSNYEVLSTNLMNGETSL